MNQDGPVQVVILAGGRGTRLAPLTDSCPKPMLLFAGKPFLDHLIVMLREEGLRRILILVGYLADQVMDYFGDGTCLGVHIEYSQAASDTDTGQRLRLARDKLDPVFLLMYCDNYWPLKFEPLWQSFLSSMPAAQVVVYRNSDGYTKSNLLVSREGWVVGYDKTRRTPNLQGVDIGFVLMKREFLDLLPEGNVSLEAELYPRLIDRRWLKAFLTEHRYYSVGSLDRLWMTEEFMRRRPALLLDRDGVLNVRMPRAR